MEQPWSDVSADLMAFPQSKSRNKYLIVFEDLFTRWVKVEPVPNATGIAVQKALEYLVVFRWGTPRRLVVDHRNEFDKKMDRGNGEVLRDRVSANSPVPSPSKSDGEVQPHSEAHDHHVPAG